jgi:hypothetical protein
MPLVARELDYTTPREVDSPEYEFPFEKNGDFTSTIVRRRYKQTRAAFTAARPLPGGVLVDSEVPGAYYVGMDSASTTPTGLATYRRTYATVPATQTEPTSINLSKPALSGTFPQVFGSFRLFQPDTTLLKYDAYGAQTVSADTGTPSYYPTGGTYTLTFDGYTTGAIAYNASAPTVQTALNALTSVSARSFCTVSGSYNSAGGFVVTFNDYAQITIAHSLTGGTIIATQTNASGGYAQTIRAGLLTAKSTITIDTTNLVASGGTKSTLIDYSDSGSLPVTANLSRCQIYLAGYYRFTGGTYTITVGIYTTPAIAYDAGLTEIQTALDSVAPGLFVAQAWETGAYGPGGFYDSSTFAFIYFSIYFVGGPATGGSYGLSALGYTTGSLAYNDSAATVAAALGALAGVIAVGGCTVTGTLVAGFLITFSNAAITANSASLTPINSTVTPAITDGTIGRTQRLTITVAGASRDLTISAHGLALGDAIYLRSGSTYYSAVTNFTIPNTNTIRLNLVPTDAWASIGTITECGKLMKQDYTPGVASIRAKNISSFYLPSVTPGISTADDIPIPPNQSDGTSLLLAIFAGTGTINYSVGQLERWNDWPILRVTKTTIAVADIS